ncbi:MAG: NADAR family protein [Paracoccus sp. (in: a-proteobacteria)]|jgi:ribA/ribD-fused uncharacterized protein
MTAAAYHFFWSGPFSQWFACEFTLAGHDYNTAEQAMMHGKALLFGDETTAREIMEADDPARQKALGRGVRGFDQPHWDREKIALVTRINLAKFGQNRGLRRKLFQTGGQQLVEASPHDLIWGIGLDAKTASQTPPDAWPGQNLLGKVLTEVRETLSWLHPEEAAACAPFGGKP